MKIEKIKKYNQILLAIGGTVAVLFCIFGLVLFMVEEGQYFFHSNNNQPSGIIATEEVEQLVEDSIRKQVISFTNLTLLDSATQLYLLPVTQANLMQDENLDGLLGLTNSSRGWRGKKGYYNSRNLFNNFVIYSSLNQQSSIVFKERVSISAYQLYEKNNQQYLLIEAADTDTNKDKYINDDDLQKLFIYEIETAKLQRIRANEAYTTHRIIETRTNEVVGQFGLDRNKSGEFAIGKEPLIYYKVDVENKRLIEMVTPQQIEQLQMLLEGR